MGSSFHFRLCRNSSHASTLLALLLLCALFLWNRGNLPEVSGEVELLFPQSSPTLTRLLDERKTFEDVYTDMILIRVQGVSVFSIDRLEEELLEVSGVRSVLMPSPEGGRVNQIFGLMTQDKVYGRVILKIDTDLSESERKKTNERIKSILKNHRELEPKRVGSFVTTQEVSRAVSLETERVIPWIVVVLALCVVLLFRDLLVSAVVLGTIGVSLLTTLSFYRSFGFPLGPISQLAPPFLLAVTASFNIHFVSRLLLNGESRVEKRADTIREVRLGTFLAALTTALSLSTLVFLDVTDVTRFCMLSACGVLLSALYATTIPWSWLQDYQLKNTNFFSLPGKVPFSSHRRILFVITIFFCGVLCYGIKNLTIDTNPLTFLPKKNATLADIRTTNSLIPGNHYLSLLINNTEDNSIFTKLPALELKLLQLPHVVRIIGPHHFENLLAQTDGNDFLSDFSLRESLIPEELFTTDREHLRLLIETSVEGRELILLRDNILTTSTEMLSERADVGVTSLELIMAEQTTDIVYGLMQSLATTLCGVFLLLLMIFRNFRIALIGLTPNVLPLLAVFGVLGFFSSTLDFGSCLVGASALGIAVDNTFHFLLCWKNETGKIGTCRGTSEAVRRTAPPFFIATVALVSAFSMMALARSEPVMHFGVLLAVTLLVGLFADLVLLPLLLMRAEQGWHGDEKKMDA